MFHNTLNALHGLFENQQLIHDIHIWKNYTQLHNTTKKKKNAEHLQPEPQT